MKLSLIVSSLSCGGAERSAVLLAESFMKAGHQVYLMTIAGKEKDFYKIPDGVQRIALKIEKDSPTLIHALWNNLYRIRVLRQTIKTLQPDAVISYMYPTNILTLISLIKTKYPVIFTEHIDPRIKSDRVWWQRLRRITYPKAAKVVSVSEGVDAYFDWLPKIKRTVIYNPLQPIKDEPGATNFPVGADPNKKWVIAMGRLTYQKNFELLISAFHKIADKHSDWQLIIFGEGELRSQLETLRENLGLTNQVLLPGITSNPISILKSSHLFVLSSRFEGLPTVLFEALACSLPVISTDCPSGPREIIRDGIDGILVPSEDVSALAKTMDRLMSDQEERKRLAVRAIEGIERCSSEKIVKDWEMILQEVVQQ